jgi:hypothetical protein
MSAKHTPGPWAYRPAPWDDWGVVRAGGSFICQARDPKVGDPDLDLHRRSGTDPWEANARLIAAAPDLLLAAKAIIYTDERGQGVGYAEAMTALAAAIAKAEGNSVGTSPSNVSNIAQRAPE